MTDDFISDLRIMAGKMQKFMKTMPGQIGSVVLESIDDNFRNQSFFGSTWAARGALPTAAHGRTRKDGGADRRFKPKAAADEGRAILVLSGRLRRSFKADTSGLTITIHTDVPYAAVHNEGGEFKQTVTVTPKMRKFFWAMFKETKDDKWKFMALSKQATFQRTIKMPHRQYMGEHPELDKNIIVLLESELSTIFGL